MKETELQNETNESRKEASGKTGKGLVIGLVAVVLLVAGGLAIFFLVRKTGNTPESVAEKILDASCRKDWKPIIDMTPDEVLEILIELEPELVQKKGLNSARELRGWALEHISEVPDPMNSKKVTNPKVDEVVAMTPEKYIELFLAGEGTNAYYPFLKSKDEIAVVKVSYIMVDGEKELDRKDSVVEYRQGDTWYPLTGLQVVYSMLQYID